MLYEKSQESPMDTETTGAPRCNDAALSLLSCDRHRLRCPLGLGFCFIDTRRGWNTAGRSSDEVKW